VTKLVVLKYSAPWGIGEAISASAYAVVNGPGGFCKLIEIAGGVAFSVCVAPVMVVLPPKKDGDVARGVN
jgi:hypothetical protein